MPLLEAVRIVKFEEYFERPTISSAFRIKQQCHAQIEVPIIVGSLNGSHSNEGSLDLIRSFQPGREVRALNLLRANTRKIRLHINAGTLRINHQLSRSRFESVQGIQRKKIINKQRFSWLDGGNPVQADLRDRVRTWPANRSSIWGPREWTGGRCEGTPPRLTSQGPPRSMGGRGAEGGSVHKKPGGTRPTAGKRLRGKAKNRRGTLGLLVSRRGGH
jgi:hypothetical protein